jgi:uncharacterized protein (TIGR03066 family)
MNTKLSWRVIGIFTILMISLTACGSANLQEEIIGKWEIRDETMGVTMVFDFQEDGALIIWLEGVPISGSYTWLDDTTVQMTMMITEQSQDITGEAKIRGDQLTITTDQGESETLTRVK